jgi:hypothetical protein
MSQQRDCSDCTFCVSLSGFQVGEERISISYCYHKSAKIDLGTGEVFPTMCEDMRKEGARCGTEGDLFAPYIDLPAIVVPGRLTTIAAHRGRVDTHTQQPRHRTAQDKFGGKPKFRRPAPYKETT